MVGCRIEGFYLYVSNYRTLVRVTKERETLRVVRLGVVGGGGGAAGGPVYRKRWDIC